MGCGQSKIGNLYPKNKKNKNSGSKRNEFSIRSASIEQKNGNGNNKSNKTNNNGAEVNRNEEQNGSVDKSQVKNKSIVPGGGPLLQQTEISTSQLDFFRMLDEKIESGPDYDESSDAGSRTEPVTSLLRRWELASVSWSNMVELAPGNPKQVYPGQPVAVQSNQPLGTLQHQRGGVYKSLPPPLSGPPTGKDREGMRNIVGGRPESAPVYVQRVPSANRVDGIQDMVGHHQHCPSPSMPRHVLESISQSPTQTLKTPPGVASPTALTRYQHYHHPELQQPVKKLLQYGPVQPPAVNGEYSTQYQDYRQYDSPHALIRNSPSNPYVQHFQIASPTLQHTGQQFPGPRKPKPQPKADSDARWANTKTDDRRTRLLPGIGPFANGR